MKHLRSVPVCLVPIENLRIDHNSEIDPVHFKLVMAEECGTAKIGLTRLHTDDIVSGFFKYENGVHVHVSDVEERAVKQVLPRLIRGERIPVEVYWSSLAPNGGSYVSPDSENVLEAYKRLNISLVPCRVMNPKNHPGKEGAVWIEKRGSRTALAKIVPPGEPEGLALVRSPDDTNIDSIVHDCTKFCELAREKVRTFHSSENDQLHYHQMCFAVLRRHERMLDSVALLVRLGRLEHAGALGRMAYEAFLNFYTDWLRARLRRIPKAASA